ncbi:DUF4345 domain-containing protein [Hydromonas duriensis]|uniref:Uncharacterized protein DUF4345 n=1 Tax=Hydromonas duriensis TaxID=1527608 RepID=A0A4R6Y899_9BURK|nr:DUF4345 domain-containing protein [Hydromonas duriensis]TDR31624.1 uncharacterized protein DUF4345 [Hydromonas duriensis]
MLKKDRPINHLDKLEQSFLISTPIVLALIGCGYLINPLFYPHIFEFSFNNINANNIYRAVGALYLSFCVFWLMSTKIPSWRMTAILSIGTLMSGLAVGRLISLTIDGVPHWLILIFLVGEVLTAAVAFVIYKLKYSSM